MASGNQATHRGHGLGPDCAVLRSVQASMPLLRHLHMHSQHPSVMQNQSGWASRCYDAVFPCCSSRRAHGRLLIRSKLARVTTHQVCDGASEGLARRFENSHSPARHTASKVRHEAATLNSFLILNSTESHLCGSTPACGFMAPVCIIVANGGLPDFSFRTRA